MTPRLGVLVAAIPEAGAILADPAFGWAPAGGWRAAPQEGAAAVPDADPASPAAPARGGLWVSRNAPITLCVSGAGKVLAAWAATLLAERSDLLLALGTSGGLGGEPIGSLWLCAEFVEHDYDVSAFGVEPGVTLFEDMDGPVMATARDADLERARRAIAVAGLQAGECRAASGDRFLADPAAARALGARTGARLVDMESAAVAKVCALRARDASGRALPFIALRSVSDNADHEAAGPWEGRARAASARFAAFLKAFAGL